MNTQVAIVTGAARGIGAATAALLATQGYAVCVNYRQNRDKAEKVVAAIKSGGGKAIAVQADIGKEADITRLFETVDRELGPVTALVNNAAVQASGGIEDLSWEILQSSFNANVFGVMMCCREAIKRMKKAGRGAIVNVSSESSRFGGNKMMAYAASKGALNTFTFGLARELAPHIRVNAVSPAVIDTDAHHGASPERLERLKASIPVGRMGDPKEVATAIAWLLSDDASYMTGTVLPITGGR